MRPAAAVFLTRDKEKEPRILGVGTYIIATQPLDPARARALLPSNAAIADINWILDYLSPVRRPSHSVRRARELQRIPATSSGRVHAQAHGARVPGNCPTSTSSTHGADTSTSP